PGCGTVRAGPRLYSSVANVTATTMTTTTPASVPMSVYPRVGPSAPGAMSPDPVTVNVPPDSSTPAGRWNRSQSVLTPSAPTSSRLHVPAALPWRLTWSKTAVAWGKRLTPSLTVRSPGEVTNSPARLLAG